MTFPRILFRAPGSIVRARYTYSERLAHDADELERLAAAGWHLTLADALDAAGNSAMSRRNGRKGRQRASAPLSDSDRRASRTKAATGPGMKPDDAAADNAPPTRAELRQKAREMDIKFGPNTSDAKLSAMIAAAMGA